MAPSIRYQILAAHGGSTLKQVGRIYEASIPPSERKPVEAIRAMAAHDEYRLVAALRDDTVLGFVALFAPPDETFALLEYLAVDKAARGAGIGAGLFRAAADAVASARRPLGLLLEVEADQAGDPADIRHRRRRIAFDRRLGCRRASGLRSCFNTPDTAR
jgi:GNAT superfamily N-acetyltransferase